MEYIKRIYALLLRSNGLKIKEIATELDIDKYQLAETMFSEDCYSYWYVNEDSLWFAKEGAIEIDEPKEEKLTAKIVVPKIINTERFLQGHPSAALRSYISRLSKYRIYSEYEITELFRKYREGDEKARELIVKSHQRLVVGIASLYTKYGIPLEDLVQEGNIGLLKAIERYDYTHFRNFRNFAKGWILQAISFSSISNPYIVGISLTQFSLYRKVSKFKEKYEQQNGYLPSVNDIEIDDVTDIEKIAFLDNLPDNLKELTTLSEDLDIYENQSNTIDDIIESEYTQKYVWHLLYRLNKRERYILQAYFGINANEESLSSIGERFHLTRERTRQILWKTVRRLQDYSGIKREDGVKIGDMIRLESSEQIGRVISSTKFSNGSTILMIRMEDGKTIEIPIYDTSYEIVPPRFLKKNISPSQPSSLGRQDDFIQSDQNEQDDLNRQREVNALDGVKVGDRIVYNGKSCSICKIVVRDRSSRFLVKYDNDVLDYVLNDKKNYKFIDSHIKPHNLVKEKRVSPQYQLSTSLDYLVIQGIITNRQLYQCRKKKLNTIGDVKQIIERYKLTPYSSRFTKYTLDMWFKIISLLNN